MNHSFECTAITLIYLFNVVLSDLKCSPCGCLVTAKSSGWSSQTRGIVLGDRGQIITIKLHFKRSNFDRSDGGHMHASSSACTTIKSIHVRILNIIFSLVRIVALVILQLQSKSNKPPAPENLNVENFPSLDTKADNVAFIATKFNITEFQNDTVEISLLEFKGNRRRKRDAIDVYTLIPDTTYRITQMNTNGSGVGI